LSSHFSSDQDGEPASHRDEQLPNDSREALVLEMAQGRRERRDDVTFDRFLPFKYRVPSRYYWSPLQAIACAASWLDELRIETVVDIGSGVGKFCVAAALASRSSFIGIEQRRELVKVARGVARIFELGPRARFIEGTFGEVTVPAASCYYFFNPFGESLFRPEDRLDDNVEVSQARALRDIHLAERMLAAAPLGTFVMTYNGFGGTLPDGYEQLRADFDLPCALRLARKHRACRW
jgi:predicted RNA methylase